MANDDPLILTEAEAARLLSVGASTLQAWRLNGEGPDFCKLGARRLGYQRHVLLAWVEARQVSSTSAATVRKRAA